MGTQYAFNPDRIPGWLLIDLHNAGIPFTFDEDQLTREQCHLLTIIDALFGLVEEGWLQPDVRDGEVHYYITPKGERFRTGTEDER